METSSFDVIIIGAGIAGASAAYFLAPHRRVAVLEGEGQPGYHSTGRSAALYTETYGNEAVRKLTRDSRAFLTNPVAAFCDGPLLSARGELIVAPAGQRDRLHDFYDQINHLAPAARIITPAQIGALAPHLRPHWTCAVYDPDAFDIDVARLHQAYIQGARRAGAAFIFGAAVDTIDQANGFWICRSASHTVRAPVLINAAGAWADQIGVMAACKPIGLQPLRRTALTIASGTNYPTAPMVTDIDESFYLKPDAGHWLISPADETPCPPCDAQPEEWDIAVAIDRVQTATHLTVNRLVSKWAGLRSFTPDRTPIARFDPDRDGFFWLAGQGGYGIQTSPALGQHTAALILSN